MAIILKANKVNLFVSSVLFVLCYHSTNILDTPHICSISWLRVKSSHLSDFLPIKYFVISGLLDSLCRHVMLCDVLELIDSYSLQVLAFVGSKFVHPTVIFGILFHAILDRSLLPVHSFVFLLPDFFFEIIHLVAVVYCCMSVCVQVGVIFM
jgi:hypothetical protein